MKNGQNHAPKVYELVETQTERPATQSAMNALLFANSDVILISYDGECLRVNTGLFRTTTLLRAAADLLQIAAERTNVRGKTDEATPDRGVPGAGR